MSRIWLDVGAYGTEELSESCCEVGGLCDDGLVLNFLSDLDQYIVKNASDVFFGFGIY